MSPEYRKRLYSLRRAYRNAEIIVSEAFATRQRLTEIAVPRKATAQRMPVATIAPRSRSL